MPCLPEKYPDYLSFLLPKRYMWRKEILVKEKIDASKVTRKNHYFSVSSRFDENDILRSSCSEDELEDDSDGALM